MELHDRIRQNVAHVDLSALFQHLWVLVHHQPAAVCEPKAPLGIMRISDRFRVLVVHSVIADPIEDRVLSGDGEAKGQENPQRQLCLVRAMGPEAMDTAGDAKAANHVGQNAPQNGEDLQLEGELE